MPKLIFVIDDEKNIREIIRSYLEKENFSVMEFDSAEPALEAFKRYKPDMLVVDIMMPGSQDRQYSHYHCFCPR